MTIASLFREEFIAANLESPIAVLRYRDKPPLGRHYRLADGRTFVLTREQCHDLRELWPNSEEPE